MPLSSEKKPTLLLVDDDAIIADSLEYVLRDEYDIARASDRPSSFELIDHMSDSPTLALVDLGLPPNTHRPDEGLAIIRKLSQMHPSTRVLVLSGQDNKKHVFQAKEDGAVDFIAKPCDPTLLKARLDHHLMILEAETQGELAGLPLEVCNQQVRSGSIVATAPKAASDRAPRLVRSISSSIRAGGRLIPLSASSDRRRHLQPVARQ